MTGKKGVSIGAAMKQRMASGNGPLPEDAPDAAPAEEVQTAEPLAVPVPNVLQASSDLVDPLESFNTRLPRSLQRRLKVHVAVSGRKIQDVMEQALSEYLQRSEG